MHFFFPSEDEEEFEESGGLDFKWRLDLGGGRVMCPSPRKKTGSCGRFVVSCCESREKNDAAFQC